MIPFDKRLGNISNILRHRWTCLVARDNTALDYLPLPPRVGYSRPASLRDILVRAKLPPARRRRQVESGFRKCGQRVDCVVCSHTTNTSVHTCNYTGQQHKIKSAVNCTSAGIVYCLSCTKSSGECARCGPQYIGCTERRLKTRFAEHVEVQHSPLRLKQ